MDRRYFFKALASGLVAVTSPQLFLPKLLKPSWKPLRPEPILEICATPNDGAWCKRILEPVFKEDLGLGIVVDLGRQLGITGFGRIPAVSPGQRVRLKHYFFGEATVTVTALSIFRTSHGDRFVLTGWDGIGQSPEPRGSSLFAPPVHGGEVLEVWGADYEGIGGCSDQAGIVRQWRMESGAVNVD